MVLFNKVEPNPPVRLVNEGSELYKKRTVMVWWQLEAEAPWIQQKQSE